MYPAVSYTNPPFLALSWTQLHYSNSYTSAPANMSHTRHLSATQGADVGLGIRLDFLYLSKSFCTTDFS